VDARHEHAGAQGAPPAPPQGYRTTVIAGACLSIAWLGDSVIYTVLPLYAAEFGIDAFMVGVLLSVNRVVRIVGYGWVAPLARRVGANTLTACACAAAALTTLTYGLASSILVFFIARCVWGAVFGILNLTMNAYAYGDGVGAGKRIGLARASSIAGPFVALLGVGPLCIAYGPHTMFVIFGLVSFAAIPLALLLPPLRAARAETGAPRQGRMTPTPLNLLFFALSFAADGVLGTTLSVLLAGFMPASSAIVAAGLLLAFQRFVGIALAVASGPVTDRIGAHRLLAPCSLLVAAGLCAIAAGFVYAGAIVVIVSRALLTTVGPVLAAERSTDRIGALAAYATWTDVGLAAGAFFGAVGLATIGTTPTYGLMTATLVAISLWQLRAMRAAAT
jgi:MFS family permease